MECMGHVLGGSIRPLLVAGTILGAGLGAAAIAHANPLPTVIIGTPQRDVLIGTRHDDVIWGRQGNDTIIGSRGNDRLRGQRGNDVLRAAFPLKHSGHDVVIGGLGTDRCIGDSDDVFRSCEVIVIRNN